MKISLTKKQFVVITLTALFLLFVSGLCARAAYRRLEQKVSVIPASDLKKLVRVALTYKDEDGATRVVSFDGAEAVKWGEWEFQNAKLAHFFGRNPKWEDLHSETFRFEPIKWNSTNAQLTTCSALHLDLLTSLQDFTIGNCVQKSEVIIRYGGTQKEMTYRAFLRRLGLVEKAQGAE